MKRYGLTIIDRNGFRKLATPQQGRHLFDTENEAAVYINAMLSANSLRQLADFFGPHPETLAVREFDCHEHGDPKGIYLSEYSPKHDLVSPEEKKRFFVQAFPAQ